MRPVTIACAGPSGNVGRHELALATPDPLDPFAPDPTKEQVLHDVRVLLNREPHVASLARVLIPLAFRLLCMAARL